MKKKYIVGISAVLFIVVTLCVVIFSWHKAFSSESDLNFLAAKIDNTVEYLKKNLNLEETAGNSNEDWLFISLCRIGDDSFLEEYTFNLLKYIGNSSSDLSSTELSRIAISAYVGGIDLKNVSFSDGKSFFEAEAFNDYGSSTKKQGVVALSYLLLVQNLYKISFEQDFYSEENLLSEINSYILSDGGFSITGDVGDVDTTAIVLLCLSYIENPIAKKIVNSCILFLEKSYENNGKYVSFGVESSESVSQVALAYISVENLEKAKEAERILLRFSLPDGSYSNTIGGGSNILSSVQALNALTSIWAEKHGFLTFSPFSVDRYDKFNSELSADLLRISDIIIWKSVYYIFLLILICEFLIISVFFFVRRFRSLKSNS
ncbi:MAG: hypothetical protein KHW62_01630 [Clostridiales bacterium]|nr:hypothetical protein [Clostridiales bacterium]